MLQFTEFVKACLFVLSHSVMSDCDYMDYSPPGSFVHEDSPGKNTGVDLPFPPPGHLPNPGIKPRSPTLQEKPMELERVRDNLATEHQKPGWGLIPHRRIPRYWCIYICIF